MLGRILFFLLYHFFRRLFWVVLRIFRIIGNFDTESKTSISTILEHVMVMNTERILVITLQA